jgi:hypothetical protein
MLGMDEKVKQVIQAVHRYDVAYAPDPREFVGELLSDERADALNDLTRLLQHEHDVNNCEQCHDIDLQAYFDGKRDADCD